MKPILFSTAMVQAILSGNKSQTRRIIKSRHESGLFEIARNNDSQICSITSLDWDERCVDDTTNDIHCKYKVGEILWVRETWQHSKILNIHPTDKNYGYIYRASEDGKLFEYNYEEWKWKPSIFMPREACRLFLEVTDVKVERLQDISEQDAISEGIRKIDGKVIGYPFGVPFNYSNGKENYTTPKEAYSALWESINGKGSWSQNPFAWCISFKRIDKPITPTK